MTRNLSVLGDVEGSALDKVYKERNRLVAWLASIYPSSLERHRPEEHEDWSSQWLWVCYIDLPDGGQASFHLHDSDLPLFSHVPRHQGRIWDGHSTEEKYAAIESLCKSANTTALHEFEAYLQEDEDEALAEWEQVNSRHRTGG